MAKEIVSMHKKHIEFVKRNFNAIGIANGHRVARLIGIHIGAQFAGSVGFWCACPKIVPAQLIPSLKNATEIILVKQENRGFIILRARMEPVPYLQADKYLERYGVTKYPEIIATTGGKKEPFNLNEYILQSGWKEEDIQFLIR